MNSDRLARAIAASLARHQRRGLVDGAAGMADVVIHGRIDLLGVADDVLAASLAQLKPTRKSWAGWFTCEIDMRRRATRQEREREKLADQLENGANPADVAITRLRLREFGA